MKYPAITINNITPQVNCGRLFAKKAIGETLRVEANIFKDGHDEVLNAVLKWRKLGSEIWNETLMKHRTQDRWICDCVIAEEPKKNDSDSNKLLGFYEYTITAWVESYITWLNFFLRKLSASAEDINLEADEGLELLQATKKNYQRTNKKNTPTTIKKLDDAIKILKQLSSPKNTKATPQEKIETVLKEPELIELCQKHLPPKLATTYDKPLKIWVDRKRAVFSSWYEFFPRNASPKKLQHGTFRDCEKILPYIADLGFDVVYFPPIHPIGITNRKGKNNSLICETDDVGSPWAIGNRHINPKSKNPTHKKDNHDNGGHRSIEPKLGNIKDFTRLIEKAKSLGLEIALDFAINCSPDHPYVHEHPEWFFQRSDGSIRFAENPPKKYEDIYPLNFHCDDWQNLWDEMVAIVEFWLEKGVKIFRVDNPHTKPVAFWQYLIDKIHTRDPEVIFLSEAFTKPNMMLELAKVGFTQSYTYFTWRNSKHELCQYTHDLFKTEAKNYFRANFWTNTPDILPWQLQHAPPPSIRTQTCPSLANVALMGHVLWLRIWRK